MKHINISESTFEQRSSYERSVLFNSSDFGINVKVQVMKVPPGGGIKPHHHEVRIECIRIISGDGVIKINGEISASSGDDVILIEPGDVHEFINKSETQPFVFFVIRTNDPVRDDMIFEQS